MAKRYKESGESRKTKYYVRAIKRIIWLLVWLFVLFVVIMGLIWVAPKIWSFVFE